MITDTAGTHESSTCRSDPFVTDLHNAQYWLISYDLFANCATFYHNTRINEHCNEIHWMVLKRIYI